MKTAKYLLSPLHNICRIFVYLAVFSTLHLQGQSLENYKLRETKKIDTTLQNLKETRGLALLSFAPNINYNKSTGVNYGISVSNIVSFIQTKKRNKIEKEKLKNQLITRLENNLNKAKEIEIEILNKAEILNLEINILKERHTLYKLHLTQYKNQEITFSKYTESKISYLLNWKTIFNKIHNLKLKIKRFKNDYNYKPIKINELLKTAKNYEIKN